MQEIDIRGVSSATPAELWRLLDDSSTWPSWTPIESAAIDRPAGPDGLGEIRSFATGRITVTEEIVERDEPTRLAYVLLGGLPVRDYRAEIDVSARGTGSEIRWHTTFTPKVPGTGWIYRRALHKATQAFVDGLTEHSAAARPN